MNEISLFTLLEHSLPAQALPWVTAALRQDVVIWRCLQEADFRDRVFSRLQPGRVEVWSPAALALAALDLPHTPERLSADIHYPLESRLRRKLASVFEGLAEERRRGQIPERGVEDLVQAGLLALALRERRRLLGCWDGLLEDLKNVGLPYAFWRTPLACLFGLVPDPLEMILALLPAGKLEGQAGLALHALLANPMPPEGLAELTMAILHKLPPGDGVPLLRCLAGQRTDLASDLTRRMLDNGWRFTLGQYPDGHRPLDFLADMTALSCLVNGAQAYTLAGDLEQALPLLRTARESSLHLYAELAAGMALALQEQDSPAALAAWEEAQRQAPASPHVRLGLIQSLLDASRFDEARQWLGQTDDGPADVRALLAIRLAAAGGEIDQARQLALRLLEEMEGQASGDGSVDEENPTWLEAQIQPASLLPATALPRLLVELGMMSEAARAAHLMQGARPVDLDLLALEGQAWTAAGNGGSAVQPLRIAVTLAPDRLDLRRQLAGAWEDSGDWLAALEQRTWMVAAGSRSMQDAQDLRLLANCAVHAGQPQRAIEACDAALALDAEDGLAHLILGQALEVAGDLDAAQEQYLLATRFAPSLTEPWLALANAQHQAGAALQALETLRSAAQALPDAAGIHLALGEAYLEDWAGRGLPAPTQALACFQQAAALSPNDVHIALRLGQTLYGLGHLLEARQILGQAYEAEPGNFRLAHAYALSLVALGEAGVALPVFAVFIEQPDYANDTLLHLAHARTLLIAGGDPKLAANALKRVLSLDPGCAEAQALLAEALLAGGEYSAAMQAFQAALETVLADDPTWKARLSLGLGQAALAKGQHEIALAALQDAAQADPHDPAIVRNLAEASYSAGLSDNALQAARTALRLAPDDLDTLAWFAEQAMVWIEGSVKTFGPSTAFTFPGALTPSAVVQLRSEMLNALTRALQIDPQRAEFLVRLGKVQVDSGDEEAALENFRLVSASTSATPGDFYQAATCMLKLGDAAGAVSCLEKAISIYQAGDATVETRTWQKPTGKSPNMLEIQILLAQAYEQADHILAALSTLEAALASAPEAVSDSLALYRAKAGLLKAQNRPAETLACLESAIQLCATNVVGSASHDLYYEAACLMRSAGDLPGALSLAEQILSSSDLASSSPYTLPAQVLAAELAHALLLPERARAFLGAPPETVTPQISSAGIHLWHYFCLSAELALDAEDAKRAEELFARANDAMAGAVRADGEGLPGLGLESSPSYAILQARLQAIQARLCLLRGEKEDASGLIQEASRHVLSASLEQGKLPLAGQLSLGEAALRLGLWEIAMRHFKVAVDVAPQEPISHLSLARALVLSAETDRRYAAVGAVRHAPGADAMGRDAYSAFGQAIDTAHQQIGKWLTTEGRGDETPPQPSSTGRLVRRSAPYRRSDVIEAQTMISRWRARGQAVFQPGPQSTQALSAILAVLPTTPEDVAAQISALRVSGALLGDSSIQAQSNRPPTTPLGMTGPATIAIQIARAYPHNPHVLIELALALAGQEEHQVEALNAGHEAVKALQPAADLWPVGNALLAGLAYAANDLPTARIAISEALACWGEEPRWQALAAEIELASGEAEAAIAHLESAVGLEPSYLPHFLALGRAYLHLAGQERAAIYSPDLGGLHVQDAVREDNRSIRQAVNILEEACRLAPDQPKPWLALADAQRAGGLLDRAAESVQRVIDLNPGDARPRLVRAEIALQAGDAQTAYDWAMEALRLEGAENGTSGSAALLVGRALHRLDRPVEALQILEKAMGRASHSLPLALERVQLLRILHGAQAATDALQGLAAQYPGEAQVLEPLAFALAEAGQEEAAIRAAQAALHEAACKPAAQASSGAASWSLTSDPLTGSPAVDYAGLHALLGRLLGSAGQLDGATHHLNEAIRLAPRRLDSYLELGRALQERRQHIQALQIFSQATQIAPRDPRPYFQAGLALKEGKDYLGAENMLRRAAALAPNDLNIHRQLGAVVALNLVHNRTGARRMNA